MYLIKRIRLIFLVFLFCNIILKGQKYIKDSVFIPYAPDVVLPLSPFTLKSVTDQRSIPGHILQISEKKQYLVIPVDYLYCFSYPLSEEIRNAIKTDSSKINAPAISLSINEFRTGVRKGGFIQEYYLKSYIGFTRYKNIDDSAGISGKLVYETTIPFKSAKKKTEIAYEKVINEWHREFVNDLNNISLTDESAWNQIVPGLRDETFIYKNKLCGISSFLAGIDWYGVEGEIFFSSPEANNFFIRNLSTVRYINTEKYESILMGKNNENFNWRINNSLIFQVQSKLLFGLNRWKDIETTEHGLEEVMQFCLGLTQNIQYDIKENGRFIFGIGLLEDLYYIMYENYDIRYGIKLTLGFKL